jgi:hypothetical protein
MPKLAARFQSLNKDELREFAYHHLPAEKWCAVEEICHLGNGDGYIVYRPRKTDTDIQRLYMFKRKEKKGKVYYYFIAKDVRAVRKELAKKMGIVEDTYKQELERKIQKSLRKNKIDYSSLGLDN